MSTSPFTSRAVIRLCESQAQNREKVRKSPTIEQSDLDRIVKAIEQALGSRVLESVIISSPETVILELNVALSQPAQRRLVQAMNVFPGIVVTASLALVNRAEHGYFRKTASRAQAA